MRYNDSVKIPPPEPIIDSHVACRTALLTGLCAALFDLDGTLVETHIDFDLMRRETLDLAATRGIRTPGWEAWDILRIVEEGREQLEARGEAAAGQRFRTDAFAMLEEIEVAHCAHPVEIAGALCLLTNLRSGGVPVGVVTRNCRRVAEQLLAAFALPHDVLLTRDDVPRTKPDPAHLLTALQAMSRVESRESRVESNTATVQVTQYSVLSTQHSLMVGDHWMDVAAGRAAGMRTVGILRGKPVDSFAPSPPDLLVAELADLLDGANP